MKKLQTTASCYAGWVLIKCLPSNNFLLEWNHSSVYTTALQTSTLVKSCPGAVAWNKYKESFNIANNTITNTGACVIKTDITKKRISIWWVSLTHVKIKRIATPTARKEHFLAEKLFRVTWIPWNKLNIHSMNSQSSDPFHSSNAS